MTLISIICLITISCNTGDEDPTILTHRLTEIKDNFGQTETFNYLGDGKLLNRELVSEFWSWENQYVYDLNGNITAINQPLREGGLYTYSFKYFNTDSAGGEFDAIDYKNRFKFLFDDHYITYYEEIYPDESKLELTINSDKQHRAEQIRFTYYNFDGSLGYFENFKILEWAEHKPPEFPILSFNTPILPGHYFSSQAFKRITLTYRGGIPENATFNYTIDRWGNVTMEQMLIPNFALDHRKEYKYITIRK